MILFQIFNSIYINIFAKVIYIYIYVLEYFKTFSKQICKIKTYENRMNLLEYIKIYHTNYEVTILQKRFIFILLDIYISETFMNVS